MSKSQSVRLTYRQLGSHADRQGAASQTDTQAGRQVWQPDRKSASRESQNSRAAEEYDRALKIHFPYRNDNPFTLWVSLWRQMRRQHEDVLTQILRGVHHATQYTNS